MYRGVVNTFHALNILLRKKDPDLISRLPRNYLEKLFDVVSNSRDTLSYIGILEQIMGVIYFYPKSAKKVFDLIIERKDVLDLSKFGNIITKTEQQFNIKVDDLIHD